MRTHTTVSNRWLSERLHMGAPDGVSRYCSECKSGKRPAAQALMASLDDNPLAGRLLGLRCCVGSINCCQISATARGGARAISSSRTACSPTVILSIADAIDGRWLIPA
jgi:hypothetical protein